MISLKAFSLQSGGSNNVAVLPGRPRPPGIPGPRCRPSRQAGCESVRAGLGCLLGRRRVPAGGQEGPTLPPPQSLLVPAGGLHLSLWPGSGSGWTRSPGYQERVGTPGGTPAPSTHRIRPAHFPGPSRPCSFAQDETRAWWPRVQGAVSCCPGSQHPPPGWALHSAPGCAGQHALGGRQRRGWLLPVCRRGQARLRRRRLAPPRRAPFFCRAILAGWRSQVGIARASMRPRAKARL